MKDKTILITGGTGSFGTAFCEHMKDKGLKRLIVLSSTEDKQDKSKEKFRDIENMRWFIGNVRDYDRLYEAFEGVDIVIHAAAMKRIDICENEPEECKKTNVDGTQNVIRAAMNRGVKKTLLISTDKAVAPINLYGTTKAMAEKLIINANSHVGEKGLKFSVCRYGNVVGSAGSVLPVWQKLISEGAKSVPVTHEDMTRFWFVMPKVIEFVLESLDKMQGGEIFIPHIPSIKITDLAKALNVDYHVVGIRKGEKIHEALDIAYTSDKNAFLTVEEIMQTI